jgi:F-type H+-transporting ATPase subunit c
MLTTILLQAAAGATSLAAFAKLGAALGAGIAAIGAGIGIGKIGGSAVELRAFSLKELHYSLS